MYLDLAMRHGVTIQQKYLVAGHTQMECDSMHSMIGRKLTSDIFTARDYVTIFQAARTTPTQYCVRRITFDEIHKLSGSYVTNIRSGEPTIHHLRTLEYSTAGEIRYKLGFSDEHAFEKLPHMINILLFEWVQVFMNHQSISLRKFNDLQSMKQVFPADAHHYYDTLPHLDTLFDIVFKYGMLSLITCIANFHINYCVVLI